MAEFHALVDRLMAAWEFTEYCAALTASATYNVNRKQEAAFIMPDTLMWRTVARRRIAPKPIEKVRYALPGERPPSMRPAGTHENVIDRFDAYLKNRNARG